MTPTPFPIELNTLERLDAGAVVTWLVPDEYTGLQVRPYADHIILVAREPGEYWITADPENGAATMFKVIAGKTDIPAKLPRSFPRLPKLPAIPWASLRTVAVWVIVAALVAGLVASNAGRLWPGIIPAPVVQVDPATVAKFRDAITKDVADGATKSDAAKLAAVFVAGGKLAEGAAAPKTFGELYAWMFTESTKAGLPRRPYLLHTRAVVDEVFPSRPDSTPITPEIAAEIQRVGQSLAEAAK